MNEALEWFFNSWFGFAVGLAIAIGCFVWAICLVAVPLCEYLRQKLNK